MKLYRQIAFGFLALVWLFLVGVCAPDYWLGIGYAAALSVPYLLLYLLSKVAIRALAR